MSNKKFNVVECMDKKIIKGAMFGLLAAISASIMSVFVKLAAPYTTNSMTIMFRFGISCMYIGFLLFIKKLRGQEVQLKTKHFGKHLLRAALGMLGMLFYYYSLRYINLSDGTTLLMTSVLFVPLLGAIFFKIKTTYKVWFAILLGFVGVIIIVRPGHNIFQLAALVGMEGAIVAALSLLVLRQLAKIESPIVIMSYYFPLAFIMASAISIFNWQTPHLKVILYLLGVGVFGTIYQEFLIRASVYVSAKIVSVLMYFLVVFGGIFDWLIWHDLPDLLTWIGIVIVCMGGILTVMFGQKEEG